MLSSFKSVSADANSSYFKKVSENDKNPPQRDVEQGGGGTQSIKRLDDQGNFDWSSHEEDGPSPPLSSNSGSNKDSPHNSDIAKKKYRIITLPPMRPFHERHSLEFTVIIIGGAALAFNAGFVNGCTYQFRGIPVSHITGTTTHAGMAFGEEDYESFIKNLALIVCFIGGSAITGSMMHHDSFHLGRSYGPLFMIGSFLFLLACIFSIALPDTDLYFYFAAMACGLQNSLTTRYSGSVLRTTHMTGAGTDIGLTLGRMCIGDYKDAWKLRLLVPLLISFLVGGCISVYAYRRMGRLTLFVNVLVFSFIGIAYSIVVGASLHIPFWKALFGLYTQIEDQMIKGTRKVKHGLRIIGRKVRQMKRKRGSNPTTNAASTTVTKSSLQPLMDQNGVGYDSES